MDKEEVKKEDKVVPVLLDQVTLADAIKMIKQLQDGLKALNAEYYLNNFTANQSFNKYSNFTTRLKVPSYSSLPAVCEVGEVAESAGKLKICSATNTWTTVGLQS